MTDSTADIADPVWITAGDYQLALTTDGIIAKNAKGKTLKSVPAKAKKTPEYDRLDALQTFYTQHDQLCFDTVRDWFLTAHPVSARLISAVWEDLSWRSCLMDLLVTADTGATGQLTGLLRGVAGEDAVVLVDLDGESVTVSGDVVLSHPALIDDLMDWREFAVELGVTQRIDQILRTVHPLPEDPADRTETVRRFVDGKYSRGSHLIGRARGAGYVATFDSVQVTTIVGGTETVGDMQISVYDPAEEAELGELSFWRDGHQLDPQSADIGPVAWSETVRMGEFLYAGRTISDDDTQGR